MVQTPETGDTSRPLLRRHQQKVARESNGTEFARTIPPLKLRGRGIFVEGIFATTSPSRRANASLSGKLIGHPKQFEGGAMKSKFMFASVLVAVLAIPLVANAQGI